MMVRFLVILALAGFAVPVNTVFAGVEIDEIHFPIPGGGWDGTARGVGKALLDSGLIKKASFENI